MHTLRLEATIAGAQFGVVPQQSVDDLDVFQPGVGGHDRVILIREEIAIVDILLAPTLCGQLRDAVPVGVEIVRSPNRIVRKGAAIGEVLQVPGLSKKS